MRSRLSRAIRAISGAMFLSASTLAIGLAVGAVPRSWKWAHNWTLLITLTVLFTVLYAIATVVPAELMDNDYSAKSWPLSFRSVFKTNNLAIAKNVGFLKMEHSPSISEQDVKGKGREAAYDRPQRDAWLVGHGLPYGRVTRPPTRFALAQYRYEDLPAARADLQRALAIFEHAYGSDHPEVARLLTSLGFILHELGDLEGSRSCFQRALIILEKYYGPDHPEVARTLASLGISQYRGGDLPAARTSFLRALEIFKENYGTDYSEVAMIRAYLQDL